MHDAAYGALFVEGVFGAAVGVAVFDPVALGPRPAVFDFGEVGVVEFIMILARRLQ